MKTSKNLCRIALCILISVAFQLDLKSQEEKEAIVKKPFVSLRYFNIQNQSQYLLLSCQVKTGKQLDPVKNLGVKIYLDDETDESNLIQRGITDQEGKLKAFIPVSFKDKWLKSSQHKFVAITDSIAGLGVQNPETEMTVSRLTIDTSSEADVKTVKVLFEEFKDSKWSPVKDVEIKLGIKRLGSTLALGEEEAVTTDSSGTATAEFTKSTLPGDKAGNLTLIAKVEDNDLYGNLETEKLVPWGKPLQYENLFGERSLWATGDKVPVWLLLVACIIIASVWGTLIYLVLRFIKTVRLG